MIIWIPCLIISVVSLIVDCFKNKKIYYCIAMLALGIAILDFCAVYIGGGRALPVSDCTATEISHHELLPLYDEVYVQGGYDEEEDDLILLMRYADSGETIALPASDITLVQSNSTSPYIVEYKDTINFPYNLFFANFMHNKRFYLYIDSSQIDFPSVKYRYVTIG